MLVDASSAKLDRNPRFTVSLKFEEMEEFEQLCEAERRTKAGLATVLILEALGTAKSKGAIGQSTLDKGKRYG